MSDIPGNRPEDAIAEAQADAVYAIFPDCTDEQMDKIVEMLNKSFEDGHRTAVENEAEAHFYNSEPLDAETVREYLDRVLYPNQKQAIEWIERLYVTSDQINNTTTEP